MNYSEAEMWSIVHSDHEDFQVIVGPQIYDTDRWVAYKSCVVHDDLTDTYWNISWCEGLTEYQEDTPPEFAMRKVVPVQRVITEYVDSE